MTIDPAHQSLVDAAVKSVTDGKDVSHAELASAVGVLAQPIVTTDDPEGNNVCDLRTTLLTMSGTSMRKILEEFVRQGTDPRDLAIWALELCKKADPNLSVSQPDPTPATPATPASVFAAAAASAPQPAQPDPAPATPPSATPAQPQPAAQPRKRNRQ